MGGAQKARHASASLGNDGLGHTAALPTPGMVSSSVTAARKGGKAVRDLLVESGDGRVEEVNCPEKRGSSTRARPQHSIIAPA
jgi:hypothetical protein